MVTVTERKLLTPLSIGPLALKHRVVMAPLTRSRSVQPGDVPGALMAEYYAQRASDGGLIVGEATTVSLGGRGWIGAPGLYSDEQVPAGGASLMRCTPVAGGCSRSSGTPAGPRTSP